MITNALTGVLVVALLHIGHIFSLPVAIGLGAAFVLAAIIDIYIERR